MITPANIALKVGNSRSGAGNLDYEPLFFKLSREDDASKLDALLSAEPRLKVFDTILTQCEELVRIRNPAVKFTKESKAGLAAGMLGNDPDQYGVWVYYPWNNHLVHILDKDDFVELRTSRNQLKITRKEQAHLATKRIGIIGLSVGKTIATTLAIERIAGELRLADFDELELSNLNRIRAGLHELGLPKVIIAAREIAELDPFIKVIPYLEGINAENIESFLCEGGKLDILVEECDGLDVKILSRIAARNQGIPVVMETNDRGMIDVERFDLEPDRAILHGLIDHLPVLDVSHLKDLTNQEKLPYLSVMVGLENISKRLADSLPELGKSITTWPQLASAVMLGGALVTDTCRRMLTNEFRSSGRFYVDFTEAVL